MGSAFDDACTVEARSRAILEPFIHQVSLNGRYVTTDKGRLARELQKTVGDVLINTQNGGVYAIEIKAEESRRHGNFFLETWSNLSRYTVGWLYTLNCDALLYHFLEEDELYAISMLRLKRWAFNERNLCKYQQKMQSKRTQMNDTWGVCVPIQVIGEQVGFKVFRPAEMSFTADCPF